MVGVSVGGDVIVKAGVVVWVGVKVGVGVGVFVWVGVNVMVAVWVGVAVISGSVSPRQPTDADTNSRQITINTSLAGVRFMTGMGRVNLLNGGG